jgi:hypothetical protein
MLADQNKLIANKYKSQNNIQYLESVFERKKIIYYKQSRLVAVFLFISSVHYKCIQGADDKLGQTLWTHSKQ